MKGLGGVSPSIVFLRFPGYTIESLSYFVQCDEMMLFRCCLTFLYLKNIRTNVINIFFGFFSVKNPTMRRGFFYTWVLLTASSAGGNFAILSYASVILQASGVTLSPELQAMSIPTVMIIGSLSSVVFVERIGRKVKILQYISAKILKLINLEICKLFFVFSGCLFNKKVNYPVLIYLFMFLK